MKILLYSRRGCHLCEQAEEMLSTVAPNAVIVDVDGSPELIAAFGLRVPVVEVDGAVVLEGRFDEARLIARLRDRG
jgi:glutaredoxin